MQSMILVVVVLFSGLAGGFLMYLGEQRTARVVETVEESEASVGAQGESPQTFYPNRRWLLLIGGIVLSNGILAAFRALFYHDTNLNTGNLLLLCSVLWSCTWTDLRAKLIPNSVLIYGLLLRCVMFGVEWILLPQEFLSDLIRSAVAAVALFIVVILCRLAVPRSIGFGDVKLLALMGFFLGTDRIWGCVFFTMIASFVYSATLLITKRANLKTEIPYAPFLLLGTVLAAFLLSP